MTAREDAIRKMAQLGAERLAEAILDAIEPAAVNPEWDSETIELVCGSLDDIRKAAGWPQFGNWDQEDAFFYYRTAIEAGHDWKGMSDEDYDFIPVWVMEHDDPDVEFVINDRDDMWVNYIDMPLAARQKTFGEYLSTWKMLLMPKEIYTNGTWIDWVKEQER